MFFDLLISLGQQGLLILRAKIGLNFSRWPKQVGVLVLSTKSLQNLVYRALPWVLNSLKKENETLSFSFLRESGTQDTRARALNKILVQRMILS